MERIKIHSIEENLSQDHKTNAGEQSFFQDSTVVDKEEYEFIFSRILSKSINRQQNEALEWKWEHFSLESLQAPPMSISKGKYVFKLIQVYFNYFLMYLKFLSNSFTWLIFNFKE